MKRFLFYLMMPALIIFTGSVNSSDIKKYVLKRTLEAATAGECGCMPAGGCGALIFFHKGAIVKAATYDSSGKEMSRQTATTTDVTDKAGILIGMIKMDNSSSMGSSTRNVEYRCDGKKLYMDLNAVMANFAALKGAKAKATSLEFPIQLAVGQTLPDASVSIETERGKMKMKMTATHIDRKVEKIEQVTTPAGTYHCFRVTSNVKTSIDMGNAAMNQQIAGKMGNGVSQKWIAWFAPDFGIVKMETYNSGKLVTRSEILSVKQ